MLRQISSIAALLAVALMYGNIAEAQGVSGFEDDLVFDLYLRGSKIGTQESNTALMLLRVWVTTTRPTSSVDSRSYYST